MDLDKLMSKHLTRYFDPSKTIPEDTLQQLLKFLRSTPTSTNIQPNHFYVLTTDEGKERLAANLGERFQDNAEKILNASHTIILTTRVLSVVDLADDGVIGVADDRGVRRPRPLVADGAVVGGVTGCSAL